jgi:TP901 family phage tail tape measure protein
MLDAGQVATFLTGRFDPAGFLAFDSANKRAAVSATEAEARINASAASVAKAHERSGLAAQRGAAAQESAAASVRRSAQSAAASTTLWSRNSEQAGKNLGTLGTVAAKGAAVGILAVGAATIYAAAKAVAFNREMLKIQTQAGGSAAEVKKLSTEVLAMGGKVPQGPKELAEGLYHIESAGFRGAQAMEMLTSAAKGAAIGGAGLEDVSQALVAVMASQIKGVHGSADAMGQLNTIVGIGDMRFADLAKSMKSQLLPAAANAGLSLKDVGAMIATITDNAVPAEMTANRLRQTLALLSAPSPKAVKELGSIGIASEQLATDMRKPNGGLKAIEDLKTHLVDSGKTATEQNAIISRAFGGGRTSAVIHTLLDELPRLKQKYEQYGEGGANGVKKLDSAWAKFQHSEAGAFGKLKSGAEAFAITVGDVVMPELTKLGSGVADALNSFIKSGGAAKVGGDIKSVFDELGQVSSNLAPDVEALAKALVDVGKAVGLGNATEVSSLVAAFAGFKVGEFIAPMILATAGAFKLLWAAVKEGELVSTAGALLSLANPVALIGTAVGVAAGLFVLLSSHEKSAAEAAGDVTAATEAERAAMQALNDTILAQADKTFAARKADGELAKAKSHLADVASKYGKASPQYKTALDEERESALRDSEAHSALAKSKEDTAKADAKAQAEAKKRVKTSKEAVELFMAEKGIGGTPGLPGRGIPSDAQGIKEKAALTKLTKDYLEALVSQGGAGTITQLQLSRVLQGQPLILEQSAAAVAKLNTIWGQLNKTQQAKLAATPEAQLAEIGNLVGQLHGVSKQQTVQILVKADNAAAQIEALKAVLAGVPPAVVIAIETNATSAAVQLAALRAVAQGVPPKRVLSIESNAASTTQKVNELHSAVSNLHGKNVPVTTTAPTAQQQVEALAAALGNLHDRTVIVTAITKSINEVSTKILGGLPKVGHASGRRPGAAEPSLVGEGQGPEYVINPTGRGMIVNSPTLMGLSPSDYVIPLEDRYRGRALGLFAQLASDMGVPGYKAGKKGSKKESHPGKHWTVPNAIPPLSLPLSDIEGKESAAKSSYEHAASKVQGLEGQVRNAERTLHYASPKGNAKAKAASKLAELKKQLSAAKRSKGYTVEHRNWQEWERTLHDAKAFQTQINERTLEANNAGNAMKLAAGRDDKMGYDAAKGRRLGALGQLQTLIRQAQKQVKTGSEYALQLQSQLGSAELEAQGTEGEPFKAADPAAEREASTGMTDDEVKRLKSLEASVALAALTPDLGDDKTAATQLVSFLETVLGEAKADPGARGGDETIKSLADSVKTARSNLASLSGSGTNENADLQAQINQKNQQVEVAQRQAQIAEGALAVFGGSGDIGSGGVNAARAAAAPSITINTLHPGDPATLTAIGNAATAGIGLQGSRRAVRQQVGP